MKIPFLLKKTSKRLDPVCHMHVDMNNPPGGTCDHDGSRYYFCGPGCNGAFQREPEAYLSGDKRLDMQ